MYAYALVGYLDNETESYFKKIWKYLSESNITQYGLEKKAIDHILLLLIMII